MSALIHALYEMDMAAIVRYVFRGNANPKLCALVPHIKHGKEVGVVYMWVWCANGCVVSIHVSAAVHGRP